MPVAGGYAGSGAVGGGAQGVLTSTDSITTGSTGRSPGPVDGGRDRVDDVAGGLVGDLAEDRVLEVQPRGRAHGDEELGAVGARPGVRHGQEVGLVEDQLGVRLVLEGVARAAGAGAERAPALDHEAVDDPVEGQAVVVALTAAPGVVAVLLGALGEADEVRDGLGSVVREQVDRDVAPVGLQDGLLVSHVCLSRLGLLYVSVRQILPRATTRPTLRQAGGGDRPVGYEVDRGGIGQTRRREGSPCVSAGRRRSSSRPPTTSRRRSRRQARSSPTPRTRPVRRSPTPRQAGVLADAGQGRPVLADARDKATPLIAQSAAMAAEKASQAADPPPTRLPGQGARLRQGRRAHRQAEEEAPRCASC